MSLPNNNPSEIYFEGFFSVILFVNWFSCILCFISLFFVPTHGNLFPSYTINIFLSNQYLRITALIFPRTPNLAKLFILCVYTYYIP